MGVETNASALEIKKAYKRLAFIHHPGIAPFTCVR
jgi:curved DNA-binding protein CbpA